MSSPTNQARKAVRAARLSRALELACGRHRRGLRHRLPGPGRAVPGAAARGPPHRRRPASSRTASRRASPPSTASTTQKQPYQVTAKRGWQDGTTPNLVHLEDPVGLFRRASGTKYTITGTSGLYDTNAKSLDLEGNVVLEQEGRFTGADGQGQHRGEGEEAHLRYRR